MTKSLLDKTRKLNKVLQDRGDRPVSYEGLANLLKETLNSNVYIVDINGVVMGSSFIDEKNTPLVADEESGQLRIPKRHNDAILTVESSLANLTGDRLLDYFYEKDNNAHKFITILPIIGNRTRLGSIVLARANKKFHVEDLILSEISATVVGIEMIRAQSHQREINERKIAEVDKVIQTLSYSELEAVQHIFDELEGEEGVLIASRIADEAGITRSVIVNALRKFESAGVIKTRSLGMKGTRIKILNDRLKYKLNESKSQ